MELTTYKNAHIYSFRKKIFSEEIEDIHLLTTDKGNKIYFKIVDSEIVDSEIRPHIVPMTGPGTIGFMPEIWYATANRHSACDALIAYERDSIKKEKEYQSEIMANIDILKQIKAEYEDGNEDQIG